MRVLAWHVHAAWSTSLVNCGFETIVPATATRDSAGLGRPGTYLWPDRAQEVAPEDMREANIDVVVLQRPMEMELLTRWTGMVAGVDVPAVYVEHNAPTGPAAATRHPLADQSRIAVVHVTTFNALMWDCGRAPTLVIEHGIPDPGPRWTGQLARAAVISHEPVRRARVTGRDLLPTIANVAPVDIYGIGTGALSAPGKAQSPWDPELVNSPAFEIVGHGEIPHDEMLTEVARRRVYVHLCRWTSLGLSLIEAMYLGMPVVGLATTEAPESLEGSGAFLSNDPRRLAKVVAALAADLELARESGRLSRNHALQRFGLPRFVQQWEQLLQEVTR